MICIDALSTYRCSIAISGASAAAIRVTVLRQSVEVASMFALSTEHPPRAPLARSNATRVIRSISGTL